MCVFTSCKVGYSNEINLRKRIRNFEIVSVKGKSLCSNLREREKKEKRDTLNDKDSYLHSHSVQIFLALSSPVEYRP